MRNGPTMPCVVQAEWEERHGPSKDSHPSGIWTGVGRKDMNTGRVTRGLEHCGVVF